MIVWGIVSMATMFVTDAWSFYVARVVLGHCRSRLLPGLVLYLTYWMPAADRARTGALFMMAAPGRHHRRRAGVGSVDVARRRAGLAGWQWLFLVEGLPAVVLGLLALRGLTDRPEQATGCRPRIASGSSRTMSEERARRQRHGHVSLARTFRSGRVWLLCAVYFLQHDRDLRHLPVAAEDPAGRRRARAASRSAADGDPVRGGAGRHGADRPALGSDRRAQAGTSPRARSPRRSVCSWRWPSRDNLLLLVLSFTLSQVGQRSVVSVFWAIPPLLLGGTAAAAGIALINAIGNLGGFFGRR